MIWTTGSRYEVAILHTAASTLQSQQPPGHQHGVPAVVTEAEEEDVVAVSCVTGSVRHARHNLFLYWDSAGYLDMGTS